MSVAKPSSQMLVLMGGGEDVDAAFRRMIDKAREGSASGTIDIVVIRAAGDGAYNDYLYNMGGVDSVETLVIKTREGADNAEVNRIVSNADLLFIAGGDQWNYINLWTGTKLDGTLKDLITRNVPFGGTSAGLAVLGQYDFSAQNDTITSAQALANPYDRRVTLDTRFVNNLPGLGATITDSHIATRDRMGRLLTFLARMMGNPGDAGVVSVDAARGIGVDERAAVVIDGDFADVLGNGAAYFLRPSIRATTLKSKTPLTLYTVGVTKAPAGSEGFKLSTWTAGAEMTRYILDVNTGVINATGNNASIY